MFGVMVLHWEILGSQYFRDAINSATAAFIAPVILMILYAFESSRRDLSCETYFEFFFFVGPMWHGPI